MRKFHKLLLALTLLVVASVLAATYAVARNDITVLVDGEEISFTDQGPVNICGSIFVPLRDVFEAIGFEVNWCRDTDTALLSGSGDTINIAIQVGAPHFSIVRTSPDRPAGHAVIIELETPAQLIGGRTLLPLRAVLENIGYYLNWDGATNTVFITSEGERAPDAPVANVRHFLLAELDDIIDLLGERVSVVEPDPENPRDIWPTYIFDTGIQLEIDSEGDGNIVKSVFVDYRIAENRFHFDGFNAESTYDDVVALFGDEPYYIGLIEAADPAVDAVSMYGYYFYAVRITDRNARLDLDALSEDDGNRHMIRFYFNAAGGVVGIRFYV